MIKNTNKMTALGIIALSAVATAACFSSPVDAASSVSVPVKVTVSETISLSVTAGTNPSVSMGPNEIFPTASTATANRATTELKVSTNSLSGWTLSVADQDNSNALVHGTDSTKTIPAGSSTPFSLTAGTPAWGIRGYSKVSGASWGSSISTTNFTGVPALSSAINWSTAFVPTGTNPVIYTGEISTAGTSKIGIAPLVVAKHGSLTAAAVNEATVVEYGVATASNQAAGTYTDTIVYMATVGV